MKKRITSFLMALLMFVSINVPLSVNAASQYETASDLSTVSTSSWMSAIRGETRLSEITIPGTHDSGAKNFEGAYSVVSSVSKCQDKTIIEQLDAGARFLDIRVESHDASDSYSAFLTHGTTTCTYTGPGGYSSSGKYFLDYLFLDVYKWLDEHPSETVIMSMKKDKGDVDITNAVHDYMHGTSSISGQKYYKDYFGEENYETAYDWTDYWYVGTSVPTLDEVRGKIVLMNRFNFNAAEPGIKIDWNDQENPSSWTDPCYELNKQGNGYIQDRYSWQKDDKWSATQQMLNLDHTKGMWYLSFSSTTWGTTVPNPEGHANEINPGLPNLTFAKGKPSGIYIMDFLGASSSAASSNAFVRKLIENNEAVSNYVTGTDGNITWELNRKTKTLTISGNGAMNDYSYTSAVGSNQFGSNAPWGDQPYNSLYDGQYNTDIIENIVVNEGVTTIGNYAFCNFDHVTSVTLPSTITSIGNNSFEYCSALTTVDISNTAVTTIGSEAFKANTSLTKFFTRDGVTSINSNAFTQSNNVSIYGNWNIYSNGYADDNSIRYIGPCAVNAKAGNTVYEPVNPFSNQDLSNGVTISFSQYCNQNKNWDGALLSFSSGKNADNEYFIIMANGAILFNDGSDGAGGTQCYFDINSSAEVNSIDTEWVDIDITISPSHVMKYYVNGTLKATYDLNSISASGYPANGTTGNNGIISFLSNSSINLYYGASFSKYGNFAGTAESYLDNASFYTRVLTDAEIAEANDGSIEQQAVYYNNFDNSIPLVKSGSSCWIVGYKERPGVLYLPEGDANGSYSLYYDGNEISNGTEEYMYSSITALYTGQSNIIGWQTAVRNNGSFTVNNYSGDRTTFTLNGDTIANAVLANNSSAYTQLDFSDFDSAYTTAKGYLDAGTGFTTDSLAALQTVVDALVYKPATGTTHTVTLYDTYQSAIDAETATLTSALDSLVSTSDFGALDIAYGKGERFLESLDGGAPLYSESLVRALRTALINAQVYESMTNEQRQNLGNSAQSAIDARTNAINSALTVLQNAATSSIGASLDTSVYQAAVSSAERLDTDIYDFADGELENILNVISMSLSGDSVTYTDLEGNSVTIQTLDNENLIQSDVDAAVSLLLSSLTDHIRMYNVTLVEGSADIGFNGNGKSESTSLPNVYKTTYNSTAVFTTDDEETAWYMEYTSNTTSRTKQYQGCGAVFSTPVLGNINVYAKTRREGEYQVKIVRDYDGSTNHPVQLIDYASGNYTLPDPMAVPFYTFEGYYIDYVKTEADSITLTEDTLIRAHYTADATKDCTVKVTDTSGSVIYNDSVSYNSMVEVSDDNAYAWVELIQDGTSSNYRPFYIGNEIRYFVTESTELVAVTKAQFDSYGFSLPLVNIKQSDALVGYENSKTKVTLNGQLLEDGAYFTLEYGLLIGKATTGTITAENLTVDKSGTQNGYYVMRAKSTKTVGANQFTINVNGVTGGIYYRGYIIYQTASGEIKTKYTDVKYQAIE